MSITIELDIVPPDSVSETHVAHVLLERLRTLGVEVTRAHVIVRGVDVLGVDNVAIVECVVGSPSEDTNPGLGIQRPPAERVDRG